MPVTVKKSAKKAVARKVNREGQRWTEDRPGMTLRLPLDLREAITEESRVKGDLARIVQFALSHVNHDKVEIQQTRKAGMDLTRPQTPPCRCRSPRTTQRMGRGRRRQCQCHRRQPARRVLHVHQKEQGAI